ncbi:MAG: TIGR00730 family Rossman fold protein [Cyanobacteriota bacterium]
MINKICVYSSSSDAVKQIYFDEAEKLGILIAQNSYTLVYGGANVGLMGKIAESVYLNKGKVIGIMPEALTDKGITFDKADELIVTKNMYERKATMAKLSDAFIALPGGFGTLEELLEILTHRQLLFHNKPVVLINTDNYYYKLIEVFEHIYNENFAKPDYREMYYLAPDAVSAINYIKNYKPVALVNKWYK